MHWVTELRSEICVVYNDYRANARVDFRQLEEGGGLLVNECLVSA